MLHRSFISACCVLLFSLPVSACFGPKLYVGVGMGAEQELLYALTALYLKEKTGVETERVALDGRDPLAEIAAQRLDLAFTAATDGTVLLDMPGLPRLVSGPRPLEDLQFTTVAPALRKLAALLNTEEVHRLVAEVRAGAAPAATARRYLSAKGWL